MLLCVRPAYAREVATWVAACALRAGLPWIWDALFAVDLPDLDKAIDLFEQGGVLEIPDNPEWFIS